MEPSDVMSRIVQHPCPFPFSQEHLFVRDILCNAFFMCCDFSSLKYAGRGCTLQSQSSRGNSLFWDVLPAAVTSVNLLTKYCADILESLSSNFLSLTEPWLINTSPKSPCKLSYLYFSIDVYTLLSTLMRFLTKSLAVWATFSWCMCCLISSIRCSLFQF